MWAGIENATNTTDICWKDLLLDSEDLVYLINDVTKSKKKKQCLDFYLHRFDMTSLTEFKSMLSCSSIVLFILDKALSLINLAHRFYHIKANIRITLYMSALC